MRDPAERAQALQDLCRVFLLIEVDSQERVVRVQVKRRTLTGAKKVRDVLHLNKWHSRLLELDAGRRSGEVDESKWRAEKEEKGSV